MNQTEFLGMMQSILDEPNREKAYTDFLAAYMSSDDSFRKLLGEYHNYLEEWWRCDRCRLDRKVSPNKRMLVSLISSSIYINNTVDIRDDLMNIATIYHESLALGLDANEIFTMVAEFSTPKSAEVLIDFINRPPELRNMKTFGLVKSLDSDGKIAINRNW